MAPAIQLILLPLFILITGATAYTNYTVGDKSGWFFNPDTSIASADYVKWAANKTFSLGDYLIFNTNSNQTVILTYNETTFHSCSIDNSSDSDTFVYTQGNVIGQPLTVVVPLTIEGPNYFFSDANDGIQCESGLAFGINVTHGVGLPPNLNQPPPPPYVDPPSNADGSDTTVVTSQPSGAGLSGADSVQRVVCYALMLCGIFGLFF
ncbi:early nodulin-like protein 18 [Bidens hawaiensis]|uniref:early nodulin-like protein 18 n=1 Tax=Bidens hawaiensis TaxID=980011 RepID=UPI0040494F28